MEPNKSREGKALRRRAEAALKGLPKSADTTGEAASLLHELQVYQVELELQNSELRQTRHELENALDRYLDFYDLSPVAFLTLERDSLIREANLTACRWLGLDRPKLLGRRLRDFFSTGDRAGFLASLSRVITEQASGVFGGSVKAAGGPRHLRMELIAVDTGRLCRVVAVDLTEQRQSERELWQERRFLRQVIDACPNLISVKDCEGHLVLANTALATCYGKTTAALLEEGREPAAEGSAHAFSPDELEVMDQRVSRHIDEEARMCADGSARFFTTEAVPLLDEEGDCSRVLTIATEITALKQTESALQESRRLRNALLAMLGQHMRHPLMPIADAADAIGRLESSNPALKWARELIDQQIGHLARMVDDLLEFSSHPPDYPPAAESRFDLVAVVRRAVDTLQLVSGEKRPTLETDLPDHPVLVGGEAAWLDEALLDLLGNILEETPASRRIRLTVRVAMDAGEGVELSIRAPKMEGPMDTMPCHSDASEAAKAAPGRPEEAKTGWAMMRQAAELHGGRLTVFPPAAGQEVCASLWLPVASLA